METKLSDDSPAAAAACPRWVMVNRYSDRQVADAEMTSMASHTSTGHLFRVSFRLVAPPACSSFYSDWAGSDDVPSQYPQIVAAHGDCLLLDVTCPNPDRRYETGVTDYFLFEAGAARPPSLLQLPACFFPMTFERGKEYPCWALRTRHMWKENTGILRRGDGEVTVAQLEVPKPKPKDWKLRNRKKAELCVLDTAGSLKWELHRKVPIVHGKATAGEAKELMGWWETDVAVPVGDRYLCFVDYFRGFLLCDMAAAAPLTLRYVPLPVEPPDGCPSFDGDRGTERFRNMAAAGAGAVRFVTVESRCCCGGAGETTCYRGQFLFRVTMWTLSLATDEPSAATWVVDGVLDCEELWAMPGYGSLPRRPLAYPIVSCDDPDVVCFIVRNDYSKRKDRKVWVLEINLRSKALRSVVPYNNVEDQAEYQVAAKLRC